MFIGKGNFSFLLIKKILVEELISVISQVPRLLKTFGRYSIFESAFKIRYFKTKSEKFKETEVSRKCTLFPYIQGD